MIKPSLQLLRFSLPPRASEFSRSSVCVCGLGRKQRRPSSSRVFTGSLAQTSRASWFPAAQPSLERSFLKVQAPLQLVGLPPLGGYLVSFRWGFGQGRGLVSIFPGPAGSERVCSMGRGKEGVWPPGPSLPHPGSSRLAWGLMLHCLACQSANIS